MAGLVLVKNKSKNSGNICAGFGSRYDLSWLLFCEGVIMRAVGDRMIIAPPLIISKAEIDAMIALIRRCLGSDLGRGQARNLLA